MAQSIHPLQYLNVSIKESRIDIKHVFSNSSPLFLYSSQANSFSPQNLIVLLLEISTTLVTTIYASFCYISSAI